MARYRRLRVPGGTYFFTHRARRPVLCERIEDLRAAFAEGLEGRPVRTDAIAVLPDAVHAI